MPVPAIYKPCNMNHVSSLPQPTSLSQSLLCVLSLTTFSSSSSSAAQSTPVPSPNVSRAYVIPSSSQETYSDSGLPRTEHLHAQRHPHPVPLSLPRRVRRPPPPRPAQHDARGLPQRSPGMLHRQARTQRHMVWDGERLKAKRNPRQHGFPVPASIGSERRFVSAG